MRWSRESDVCREKPKHTAPHTFYIYTLERGTPVTSLNLLPGDRASKELELSSFSEKTSRASVGRLPVP